MGGSVLDGFLSGLFFAAATLGLLVWRTTKKNRQERQGITDAYEVEIAELRRDQTTDRENNRRLRHQLAVNSPESLGAARQERDQALDELDQLTMELRKAAGALSDRDNALREARLAIHDIRVQLERERVEVTSRAAVLPMMGMAPKAEVDADIDASADVADQIDDKMFVNYSIDDATAS